MIIVDETVPVGDLPISFPSKNVEVNFEDDVRDHYELQKEIGRGRFGTVYLVTCKKSGLKFAAKFVNTKRNQDRQNVEREIEVMKLLNQDRPHPKLIQLYDAFDMGKEMCLIQEVVDGGELFERVIDDDFVLTERACAIFIRQICEGIEFIHSKNVLHLDMKPENILCLSRQGNRIKICDFGLARFYDPRKKLQVLFGTPEFVAPEVVNFEPISFGTDMWSVGVICYVLLSGLSPFMGHNYVETMTNVTHNKYDFDDEVFDEISEDAKDFIEKLLILEKSERLTPDQCIRHKWVKKMLSDKYADSQVTVKGPICNEANINVTNIISTDKTEINANLPNPVNAYTENKENINNNANIFLINSPNNQVTPVNNNTINNANVNEIIKNKNSNLIEDSIKKSERDEDSSMELLHSERKRKERETEELELETSKKQMKDFVENWKSNSTSPFLVESSEKETSITKMDNTSINNTEDFIKANENSVSKNVPISGKIVINTKDNSIANELNEKLLNLEKEDSKEQKIYSININKQEELNKNEDALISKDSSTQKASLKRQDAVQEASTTAKLEKEHSVKLKPSRDVPFVPPERVDILQNDANRAVSPLVPAKRSRRSSKEEFSIFDKEITNYRRPSRDVPMNQTQKNVLHSIFPGPIDKNRATTQEIWPDVICISKDKDAESNYAVEPVTGKLELPIRLPTQDVTESSSKSSNSKKSMEKAKSLDDPGLITLENKNVTWVMDLSTTEQICSSIEEKMKNSVPCEATKKCEITKNTEKELASNNKLSVKSAGNSREPSPFSSRKENLESLKVNNQDNQKNLSRKNSPEPTKYRSKNPAIEKPKSESIEKKHIKEVNTNIVISKTSEKVPAPVIELSETKKVLPEGPAKRLKTTDTISKSNNKTNIETNKNESIAKNKPSEEKNKSIEIKVKQDNHSSIDSRKTDVNKTSTEKCNVKMSPSSSRLGLTSSSDDITVNTPWGVMRKSPSRTNLKASDKNVIMINLSEASPFEKKDNRSRSKSPNIFEDKTKSDQSSLNKIKNKDAKDKHTSRWNSPDKKEKVKTKNNNENQSKVKKDIAIEALNDSKQSKNSEFKSFEIPIKLPNNLTSNKENTSSELVKEKVDKSSKKHKDKSHDLNSLANSIDTKEKESNKNINGYNMLGSKKKNFSTSALSTAAKRREKYDKLVQDHEIKDPVIKIDISYEEMFGKLNRINPAEAKKVKDAHNNKNANYSVEEKCVTHINKNKSENINTNKINTTSNSSSSSSKEKTSEVKINQADIIQETLRAQIFSKLSKEHIARNGALINELISQNFSSEEINFVLTMADEQSTNKKSCKSLDVSEPRRTPSPIPDKKEISNSSVNVLNTPNIPDTDHSHNSRSSKSPVPGERFTKDSKPPADPSKKRGETDSEKSHTLPRGIKSHQSLKSVDKQFLTTKTDVEKTEEQKTCGKNELDKKSNHKNDNITIEKNNEIKPQNRKDASRSNSRSSVGSKRNSMSDSEDNNPVMRRNSRSSASPSKNTFRMSVFSAQDRISLFEQKKENPPRAPVPITKSRTSICLGETPDYQPPILSHTRV